MKKIFKIIAYLAFVSPVAFAQDIVSIGFDPNLGTATATMQSSEIGRTLIFPHVAVSALRDSQNVWLATSSNRIFVYSLSAICDALRKGNLPEPKVVFTDKDWSAEHGYASNAKINSMFLDNNRNVWIGLEAGRFSGVGGLVRFTPAEDSSKGAFRLFTKRDGLPSNRVREIKETEDGIAVVTANGTVWVDISKKGLAFQATPPKAIPTRDQRAIDALDNAAFFASAVVLAPIVSVASTTYAGHLMAPINSVKGVALLPLSVAAGMLLTLSVWSGIAVAAIETMAANETT